MLDRIIYFSIHNKLIVGLLTMLLVAWGAYSFSELPIDAVPDITNNQVQVITISPSQAASDIERLVTFPVEIGVATVPGIEEVRSFSRFGLSVVTIVFRDDIDIYWARQQVSERLTEVQGQIPPGAGVPKLAPITTGLGEIYQYVLYAQPGFESKYSPMELRTIQDWVVRRQLLGTDGVADVASYGGYLKQYEIALDIDKLRSFNLSVGEIFAALEKNNQNTGGAYIDKKPNAYFIRSEGLITNLDDLRNIVVRNTAKGIPIFLKDVAEIQFGHAIRYGAMTQHRRDEAVGEVTGGIVLMLKGSNSSHVIKNVKARIEQIKKNLPEGVTIDAFLDRTKLVNKSITTVTTNLAEGALIVIFVLVLLLGNLRAGLIVSSAIPLAMLFAVSMMNVFGVSGNLMSLGAIDFGLIVDGSVIIVEATMHHLALRNIGRKLSPIEMDEEVYHSASRIRNSAAFGEIIILIVYLPILALVGVEGKMFRPMAQTVSFAILGSFILSITYIPMMSALFLSRETTHKRNISDRLIDFLQLRYAPVVKWTIAHRMIVVSSSVILFAVSLWVFSGLGAEFIPTLDEGDFAVETRLLTGSSLTETVEGVSKASEILSTQFPDEVKEVIGKIGSSEIPVDPMPIEAADLIVVLADKKDWKKASTRDELAEKMSEALSVLPGINFGFQQPIQMRFNELMTGARQDVVVKVYGEDLDKLSDYARRIASIIPGIRGAQDLYVESVTGLSQLVVSVKRERLAPFGLSIDKVNQTINMAFAGQSAGMVFENERRFYLVVRLDRSGRQSIDDLSRLFITAPSGEQVPLSQIADVELKVGPNQIQRDDTKRRITIGFNVRGRDVESIVNELRQKIDEKIRFAPGYYPTFGGTFKNLQEARARLNVAVPVALALIFVLLYLTFRSIRQSLLIYTAIPLSAIGGVFALWIRDMPFSISAGVGFIALSGVAVLNGIVLIAEFNHLKTEGEKDLQSILLKGTATRLRPVIITAAVASLGFLPMALSHGDGAEVQRPLATVVIGGLLSATALTLVVLPCLYYMIENFHLKKMKTKAIIFLLGGLMLSPLAGRSQQAVTLDEAVDLALKNNLGLRAANFDIEFQQQQKRTATEIPKTAAMLMYGQYNSINQDNNITITQNLPFPTVFTSQSKLGEARIQSSEFQKASAENDLVYRVRQTYLTLQFMLSKQKLLERQDSIFSDLVRITSVQHRTGEGTLLQKTSAEARYNEVQNLKRQNESDIKVYNAQLRILLNLDDDVRITDEKLIPLTTNLLNDTAQVKQNPQLAFQKSLIEVALREKKVDFNKALPDLSIGYFNQTLIGYQQLTDGTNPYFGPHDRFSGFMAGIAIPLWFVPYNARIRSAAIKSESVRATAGYFEKQLVGQWEKAVQDFNKNKNSLDYYTNSALPNAKLILSQSQSAFRTGEISQAEYRMNLQQALSIEEGYLQALYQYDLGIITLEFLSGNKK
ncbi:MAG TPA: CusA/CzcA family heavy metal efflux RND transporter [Cyclobacteriaceae bacterium]|nr:CusA/CzcA family heavy metal efflux RND transporter [Cyclobacteriaceae bacterium]